MKKNIGKHNKIKKKSKKIKKIIIIIIFFIILTFSSIKYININKNAEIYKEISSNIEYNEENINLKKIKYAKNINSDVIGWLEVPNTMIDYPILQSNNNDYYLKYNYKREESKYGSIFLNYKSDINDENSNLIIYGHNMGDNQMFNELLKYRDEEYFKKHKIIKISNEQKEYNYSIIAVFKSRVFYQDEEDVFRYYNYTYFNNEEEYNNYIKNVNQLQLYNTNVSAKYGEQLATLITCEYSQKNGRLVIVAKKELK